jgi:hypothetical protein
MACNLKVAVALHDAIEARDMLVRRYLYLWCWQDQKTLKMDDEDYLHYQGNEQKVLVYYKTRKHDFH